MTRQTFLAAAAIAAMTTGAYADFTSFEDFDAWQDAGGPFTTLTFTKFEHGTVVTDQYADLGVTFPDGNNHVVLEQSSFGDGHGLRGGDGTITLDFDQPQAWVGHTHFGLGGIELYDGDELIYSNDDLGASGGPWFAGVVSAGQLFDRAVLFKPTGAAVKADDIYFGVPTPGAVAVLALAGVFGGSRRRRA